VTGDINRRIRGWQTVKLTVGVHSVTTV